MISSTFLQPGFIINNSYKIINLIGQGGFGRTYLVESIINGQKRVLKEFAPQVSKVEQITKAQELFDREVGTLKRLNHPQIPQFHELIQITIEGENRLFFVQDYIEGNSYQGQVLHQTEVIKLLQEILPVLSYIHQENIIHRDLSPDNILQRKFDGKPILIDFGAVKIASSQVSRLFGQFNQTRIGKTGYVPDEQILRGQAFPSSDLYALGVTMIVLLTGESPQKLQKISSSGSLIWTWEQRVNIDQNLANILNKMIIENHFHRYQSAQEVLQELNNYNLTQNYASHNSQIPTQVTVIAPDQSTDDHNFLENFNQKITWLIGSLGQLLPAKKQVIPVTVAHSSNIPSPAKLKWFKKVGIVTTIILLPGLITFALARGLITLNNSSSKDSHIENCSYSNEAERQKCIYNRILELKLDVGVFYQEVDSIFYEKYPELKGQKLGQGDSPQEKKLREEWYKIAEQLLEKKS